MLTGVAEGRMRTTCLLPILSMFVATTRATTAPHSGLMT